MSWGDVMHHRFRLGRMPAYAMYNIKRPGDETFAAHTRRGGNSAPKKHDVYAALIAWAGGLLVDTAGRQP
jgi:hypothetical protein